MPPADAPQVGYDMTSLAARRCFTTAGLEPSDVDVVELHDCFSANELITYEALGLCAEGESHSFSRHASVDLMIHDSLFATCIVTPAGREMYT